MTDSQGAVSEHALTQRNPYQPDGGERFTPAYQKTFRVVGVIERPETEPYQAPGYTVLTYLDSSLLLPEAQVTVAVRLRQAGPSLFGQAKELAKRAGMPAELQPDGTELYNVRYHDTLLAYEGSFSYQNIGRTVDLFALVVILIILAGSVSLIHNAFAISLSERSQYLGMLSSIGATKRQKRQSVFFEGFILGAVSIPLGVLFGALGLGITFVCINPMFENLNGGVPLKLVVSPYAVGVSIFCSALAILFSSISPALRSSRISPIDAIRQSHDICLTARAVKTSRLTRALFGVEGEIALKNMKRNRRRYRSTIFSIAVSLVLFLTASSVAQYVRSGSESAADDQNYDVRVFLNAQEEQTRLQYYTQLTALPSVQEATVLQALYTMLPVEFSQLAPLLQQNPEFLPEDGQLGSYCPFQILCIDDQSYARFAKETRADQFAPEEGALPGILINRVKIRQEGRFLESDVLKLSVGDTLSPVSSPTFSSLPPLTVAATTDQTPLGASLRSDGSASATLVVSPTVFAAILSSLPAEEDGASSAELYLRASNAEDFCDKASALAAAEGYRNSLSIQNVEAQRREAYETKTVVLVFVYGFVALIALICFANVTNTVTTSIGLRRREFAMLKSVGMTPKSFRRMLRYESLLYGFKALLYGLPVSFLVMYFLYHAFSMTFFSSFLTPWRSILLAAAGIFLLVSLVMLLAGRRVKKENIADALKREIF